MCKETECPGICFHYTNNFPYKNVSLQSLPNCPEKNKPFLTVCIFPRELCQVVIIKSHKMLSFFFAFQSEALGKHGGRYLLQTPAALTLPARPIKETEERRD